MTKNQELPSFKFLSTATHGDDLFKGGSHKRISSVLSKTISSNNSETKLIGLDGPWGSGKSNIIDMLGKELNKSHHLFLFDAWGHQEDLKRRSFLEELTEDLIRKNLINKEKWEKKLKDLLAKKRETDTKTIPRLSNGFIVTIIVGILTPVFKSLSDTADEEWYQLLITLIPISVGLIMYGIASFRNRGWLSIAELFHIYKEKELTNTTHVTISEREPTVRNFQRWMKDLSDDLIQKKLIVVFDNMDRLPPDKVKELWSSIHTFFAEHKYENLWVIVPFDRSHISEAFSDENGEFIAKTFTIVHRVTPPVVSDWKNFFKDKYDNAFPKELNSEFVIVRNIFDLVQDHITPRIIISFINEMVSLRMVFSESEIKSRYLALFCLKKETLFEGSIEANLLESNFLGKAEEIFYKDSNLLDSIAALAFGVSVKDASQVTLSRSIELSLRDQKVDDLVKASNNQHFSDILEQVIYNQTIQIEETVLSLSQLKERLKENSKKGGKIEIDKNTWALLKNRRQTIELSNISLSDVDRILIEECSEDQRITHLKYLVNEFMRLLQEGSQGLFNGYMDLERCIKENQIDVDFKNIISEIELAPQEFLDFVSKAKSNFKSYKINVDQSALDKFIDDKVQNNEFGELKGCIYIKDDYDLAKLVELIESKIRGNSLDENIIGTVYYLYEHITDKRPLQIMGDTQIHNMIQKVGEDKAGYQYLLAMRLTRANNYPSQYGGKSNKDINSTGADLIESLSNKLLLFDDFDILLLRAKSWSANLLNDTLKHIINNTIEKKVISKWDELLRNFKSIIDSTGINGEDLLSLLDKNNCDEIKSEINESNLTDYIDENVIEYSANLNSDLSNFLNEKLLSYFDSMDRSDWLKEMNESRSFVSSSIKIVLDSGKMMSIPEELVLAYKDLIKKFANEEIEMKNSEVWESVYQKTHKSKFKGVFQDVKDIFVLKKDIKPQQFVFFIEKLIAHARLDKNSDDVIRRIITPMLKHQVSLKAILKNSDELIPLVNKAKDQIADFQDELRKINSQTSSNEGLKEFAKKLDVDLD